MQNKKQLIMYIIIVLVLILLFLGIGLIVYKSAFEDTESKNNNNDDELNTLGLRLYNYVNIREGEFILFDTENVLTYNDLQEDQKLMLVHALIPNTAKTINEECGDDSTNCIKESISQRVFQRYYDRLFGRDKNINYQNYFEYIDCLDCYFADGMYQCKKSECKDVNSVVQYINYDSVKMNNNDVILNVKSIFVSADGVYKDKSLQNKLDSIDYYNEVRSKLSDEDYYKGLTNHNNLNYNNFLKRLFEKYVDAAVYEVTFKEYDDNYYWYSTRLVK